MALAGATLLVFVFAFVFVVIDFDCVTLEIALLIESRDSGFLSDDVSPTSRP